MLPITVLTDTAEAQYEKEIKVTDTVCAAIRLACGDLHGEWKYVMSPNQEELLLPIYAFLPHRPVMNKSGSSRC